MELKLKPATSTPGGWTKTKLMLFSTQVELGIEVVVELGKSLNVMNVIRYLSMRAY